MLLGTAFFYIQIKTRRQNNSAVEILHCCICFQIPNKSQDKNNYADADKKNSATENNGEA